MHFTVGQQKLGIKVTVSANLGDNTTNASSEGTSPSKDTVGCLSNP